MNVQNPSRPDPYVSATAPKSAEPTKIDNVTIKQAANGGFIVRCDKTGEGRDFGGFKSEESVFESLDGVLAYVTEQFGGGAPAEAMPPMEEEGVRVDAYEAPAEPMAYATADEEMV